MKELMLTPEYCANLESKNKPAIITISKMNVTFNSAAVVQLALKEKVKFLLVMVDDKLYYKEPAANGFEIKTVDSKSARFINKGLHYALCENIEKRDKSFRFEIGEFKEGMRLLTLIK